MADEGENKTSPSVTRVSAKKTVRRRFVGATASSGKTSTKIAGKILISGPLLARFRQTCSGARSFGDSCYYVIFVEKLRLKVNKNSWVFSCNLKEEGSYLHFRKIKKKKKN